MQIDALELFWIKMPMVGQFTTSFGTTQERDILLVKASAGDAVGWGESGADGVPMYSYETARTGWHIIEDFIAGKLAEFVGDLEKLKLLDDTIVVIAGNMGDPSLHSMKDMSVILAGGGFKHAGSRIPCKEKGKLIHPLANLYTTVLHQLGLSGLRDFAGIPGDMDDLLT